MYSEDDLLPISALQHLEFCPRRCALVHVEGIWADNVQTAEGRALHDRVHQSPSENAGGIRIARRLRLCSQRLGLFGVADVVEFHPAKSGDQRSFALPNLEGRWTAFPVEYKRGRKKPEKSYMVQLCAQALCLEEMLGTHVPAGALYHGKSRRRQVVQLNDALRSRTEHLAGELRRLIESASVPPPVHGPKCKYCSLFAKCMPKLSPSRSARVYVAREIAAQVGGNAD